MRIKNKDTEVTKGTERSMCSTGAGIRLPNNAQNVVIRNTLGNNSGGNYLVGTGNGVGPIISIAAGNVGNHAQSGDHRSPKDRVRSQARAQWEDARLRDRI